ncbi:MAG: VOC family protein [Planctomycetota bacterium]
MQIHQVTPILNVRDVPASLEFFEALGWQRTFAWNDAGMIEGAASSNAAGPAQFAGMCVAKSQLFLCRDGQGGRGGPGQDPDQTGVWMSWWMSSPAEVDALYQRAGELGFETPMAPRNEPWGVREFWLRHPDGHTFRVSAGLGSGR